MKTVAVLGTTVAGGVGGFYAGVLTGFLLPNADEWTPLTTGIAGIVLGALAGVAIGVHFFT